MRVLIDSSTLIALAKIGKLNILEIVFKEIFITTVIKDEILREDSPETEVFKGAINRWINIIDFKGKPKEFKNMGWMLGKQVYYLQHKPMTGLYLMRQMRGGLPRQKD